MAFRKFARATVVHPHVTRDVWQQVRQAARLSQAKATAPAEVLTNAEPLAVNLVDRAAQILGHAFDPSKYLLSHCSIVCSVDTYAPSGTRTGSVTVDGEQIRRKYANYRITPETEKYVNHNFDAWDRAVLLKAFRTFIGGQNFVEHVQLPELSKGRILDAVARDIGESVYIDILVATDRKHVELVQDIESEKMSTLSMGCTTTETQCTRCGHVAIDETELCRHIQHEKGNTFYDEQGRLARVAELCGHSSLEDPPGGVQFIEASWVGTPAFTGAVVRNILAPTVEMVQKAATILASPPAQWSATSRKKAASASPTAEDLFLAGWDDGEAEVGDPASEPAPSAPAEPSKLDDLEGELEQYMLDRVRKRIRQKMDGDPKQLPSSTTNDNIVREARAYKAGVHSLLRVASTDVAFMDGLAAMNQEMGMQIPVSMYRTALRVGSVARYRAPEDFLGACRKVLGKELEPQETRLLIGLGKLLARWENV